MFTCLYKYNYKSRRIFVGFIFLVLTSSCRKLVEVDAPDSKIVGSEVYSSNSTATAAVTGIYDDMMSAPSKMSSGLYSISTISALMADEFRNYSSVALLSQAYTNSFNGNPAPFWGEIYNLLHSCNAALEGLDGSNGITAPVKQQLIGEAKFLRAYLNFYLVNFFGDAPLVTTSNYLVNNTLSRSSVSDIYVQIISDLQDAQSKLSNDYWAPGNLTTSDRVRPNKAAAAALLARVYLFTKQWANAEVQANQVISDSRYRLLSNLDSVFLANSSEAIWQLQPVVSGFNTFDGFYYVLTSTPGSGRFPVSLSTFLLSDFEAGDQRFVHWVDSFVNTSTNVVYYYSNKYKQHVNNTANPVSEYQMVFRLSEQYLIRAEARAQLGDLTNALADLDTIRVRAGLMLDTSTLQANILKSIYHERRIELFSEFGARWFDLKRTGLVSSVMGSPGNICAAKGGIWSSDWELLPLSINDITINHNLVQNPGYPN